MTGAEITVIPMKYVIIHAKISRLVVPILFLLFVPGLLFLPWATLIYNVRIAGIEKVHAEWNNTARLSTSIHAPVKVGLLKCLGGICGKQKHDLRELIVAHEKNATWNFVPQYSSVPRSFFEFSNRTHYDTTSTTSILFDNVALWISQKMDWMQPTQDTKLLEQNLRYDPQVVLFFRASVMNVIVLITASAISMLSISFQAAALILQHCTSLECVARSCGATSTILNSILSACPLISPMIYLLMTWKDVALVKGAHYEAGFYLSLIGMVCIYVGDRFAARPGLQGHKTLAPSNKSIVLRATQSDGTNIHHERSNGFHDNVP